MNNKSKWRVMADTTGGFLLGANINCNRIGGTAEAYLAVYLGPVMVCIGYFA
ncbi:hypothetical protein [Petroclostridium sp. X23]|uniref:hypothetical protein n=1 Tax=Petroclostridium sp. X23 TaxID=3045146 RepID=UPI0024AD11D9|nr:hypothetical protein [Petroclostridium sp. X23]WHH58456.1 hypothetical protein QKW49_22085 [Petroclostridium sp. X23]